MATVIEPKPETKPAPETPARQEPELFAAEIEMEGKSSNLFPILFIAALVIVVGGTIYYFVKGAKDVLTIPAATASVNEILKAQGPASISFTTGTVVQSVSEKPQDPHYKMLAKAGVVITKAKAKDSTSLIVTLTPAGETLLSNINDVQKKKNADGNTSYSVPLAVRKLLSVDKVTMIRPHLAKADYTWRWESNRLGREFDASGALVKSFSTWDRATLIKSYGVDFFGGDPTRSSVMLMEANDGTWKPYSE